VRTKSQSGEGYDYRTGLTEETTAKLMALYAKTHGTVFDQNLWEALSNALIAEASSTPLPAMKADEVEQLYQRKGYTLNKDRPGEAVAKQRSFDTLQRDYDTNVTKTNGTARPSRIPVRGGRFSNRAEREDPVGDGVALTEEGLEHQVPDLIMAI